MLGQSSDTREGTRYTQQWTLTTSAVTANQQIGTDTPTRKVKIRTIVIEAYYTTLSTTPALLGDIELRINGTTFLLLHASNTSSGALFGVSISYPKGLAIEVGEVLDAVCSPAVATSIRWIVNISGAQM